MKRIHFLPQNSPTSGNLPYKILHEAIDSHQRVIVQKDFRLNDWQRRGHWFRCSVPCGRRRRVGRTGRSVAALLSLDCRCGCSCCCHHLRNLGSRRRRARSCSVQLAVVIGRWRRRCSCIHLKPKKRWRCPSSSSSSPKRHSSLPAAYPNWRVINDEHSIDHPRTGIWLLSNPTNVLPNILHVSSGSDLRTPEQIAARKSPLIHSLLTALWASYSFSSSAKVALKPRIADLFILFEGDVN